MWCSFIIFRGPRGPRPKFVDRGVLHGKQIAHKNKHAAILLYSVLLRNTEKILIERLIVKVLQTFEVVKGSAWTPHIHFRVKYGPVVVSLTNGMVDIEHMHGIKHAMLLYLIHIVVAKIQ